MENNEREIVPDKYSFSGLSSFEECPYGYSLTYEYGFRGEDNVFSQYGKAVHSLMERCAKGELKPSELVNAFDKEWENIKASEFPSLGGNDHLAETYYINAIDYLMSFKGFNGREILGVEEEFMIPITTGSNRWTLHGFIDLVYKDCHGDLIIRDYKSKGGFKSKREVKEYARQLYLYSEHVFRKYGKYPDYLEFELFREQQGILIRWKKEEFDDAFKWADEKITEIKESFDFPPKYSFIRCNYLCNHRNYCDLKQYAKMQDEIERNFESQKRNFGFKSEMRE